MEVSNVSMLNIPELHEIIRGNKTSTKNFLICDDVHWDGGSSSGEPYKANTAAFVFCTEGEMELSIGIRKHRLHKNTIMLYGPGNVIQIHNRSPDFHAKIMIFTRDFVQATLLDLHAIIPIYQYLAEDSNDFMQLEPDEVNILNKYFLLMVDVVDRYNDAIVNNLITAIFRTISDMYGKRTSKMESPKIRSRQDEYFERFMVEVVRNHRKQRSVQFYADALHITPKYLSTVIKEISKRSAAKWIDEFVVQEAKVLLKYSPKSIQEITYYLNFSTQSFFGKYFKRHVGMSPSQYRNNK